MENESLYLEDIKLDNQNYLKCAFIRPTIKNLQKVRITVQIGNIKIKNYETFFEIEDLDNCKKVYGYQDGFFKTLSKYNISKKEYLEMVKIELERLILSDI